VRRCREFTPDSVTQFTTREHSLLAKPGSKHHRLKKTVNFEQIHLAKAVSMKLEEGNYRGAVRLICSDDVHAPLTDATLLALRLKHPNAPADRWIPRRPEAAQQFIPVEDSSDKEAIMISCRFVIRSRWAHTATYSRPPSDRRKYRLTHVSSQFVPQRSSTFDSS